MSAVNSAVYKLKENKSFYLVFVPTVTLVFVFAFLMLIYPQVAADGVKKGISLCLETVIPALFPFMFAVTLIYDIGIFNIFIQCADGLMYRLFRLPGVALPIMLMSFLGGFPVGAILIEKAFEDGELTSARAQRMLMFCVNPGPAFTVSVIGVGIIGSAKAGAVIYISVTLSSLIVAFLSRFIDTEPVSLNVKRKNSALLCNASVLSGVIGKATKSMANICVSILVFSCIDSLTEILFSSEGLSIYFGMLSEVTNGVITASEHFSLPVVAAVVSFSGLCVHFQVLPVILKLKLKYRLFFAIRVLTAALSCMLSFAMLQIFPQYDSVISLGIKPQNASLEVPFPVCVWLMVMCGLFLIGDNYILSKKLSDKSA